MEGVGGGLVVRIGLRTWDVPHLPRGVTGAARAVDLASRSEGLATSLIPPAYSCGTAPDSHRLRRSRWRTTQHSGPRSHSSVTDLSHAQGIRQREMPSEVDSGRAVAVLTSGVSPHPQTCIKRRSARLPDVGVRSERTGRFTRQGLGPRGRVLEWQGRTCHACSWLGEIPRRRSATTWRR